MYETCKNKFKVRPIKLEALLYYSQTPEGHPSFTSLHGECPLEEVIFFIDSLTEIQNVDFYISNLLYYLRERNG